MPGTSQAAQWADELEARLRTHANPVRSAGEQRYMKSSLEFIGSGVPAIRAETREWERTHPLDRRQLLALVRALWGRRVHELKGVAIVLLQRHAALLTSADFPLLERLIRSSRTWAYVDPLAGDIVGALVERDPSLVGDLDRWAQDDDFWMRRAAMLTLLRPIRAGGGDFERFARYADTMLEDREFFIRKAIGWVLREAGKRRPAMVADWLLPRAGRASRVTTREAVKYLDAAARERILAAAGSGGRVTRGA